MHSPGHRAGVAPNNPENRNAAFDQRILGTLPKGATP